MRWLEEYKEYIQNEVPIFMAGVSVYSIDGDTIDRLIAIVERAEWTFLCPSGRRFCELCGGQKPMIAPTVTSG